MQLEFPWQSKDDCLLSSQLIVGSSYLCASIAPTVLASGMVSVQVLKLSAGEGADCLISCQHCRMFCTASDLKRLIFVPNANLYKTGLILLSTTLHISSQAHAQMALREGGDVSYGAC